MTIILSDSFDVALTTFTKVRSRLVATSTLKNETKIQEKWDDELGRLRLWASNIGAHQRGQSSLDFRLRDASNIRDQIDRLLRNLCDALQDVEEILDEAHVLASSDKPSEKLPEDDSLAELEQVHQTVVTCVDCLFQMSMLVRKPARHDMVRAPLPQEVLAFEPWYKNHIRSKFPKTPNSIVERLALAMLRRRHYLGYRERHRAKLGKGLEIADDAASRQLSETVVSGGVPTRIIEDTPSEVGTATSYASSILTGGNISMPPFPPEGRDGKLFECPYCFVIISAKTLNAWHKHVFEDLQPYICVVPDCPTPATLFSSRRKWAQHLKEVHQQKWYVIDEQERQQREPMPESILCGLCSHGAESDEQLMRHLSKHLQEIALFVLPRPEVSEEGSEEEGDTASFITHISLPLSTESDSKNILPSTRSPLNKAYQNQSKEAKDEPDSISKETSDKEQLDDGTDKSDYSAGVAGDLRFHEPGAGPDADRFLQAVASKASQRAAQRYRDAAKVKEQGPGEGTSHRNESLEPRAPGEFASSEQDTGMIGDLIKKEILADIKATRLEGKSINSLARDALAKVEHRERSDRMIDNLVEEQQQALDRERAFKAEANKGFPRATESSDHTVEEFEDDEGRKQEETLGERPDLSSPGAFKQDTAEAWRPRTAQTFGDEIRRKERDYNQGRRATADSDEDMFDEGVQGDGKSAPNLSTSRVESGESLENAEQTMASRSLLQGRRRSSGSRRPLTRGVSFPVEPRPSAVTGSAGDNDGYAGATLTSEDSKPAGHQSDDSEEEDYYYERRVRERSRSSISGDEAPLALTPEPTSPRDESSSEESRDPQVEAGPATRTVERSRSRPRLRATRTWTHEVESQLPGESRSRSPPIAGDRAIKVVERARSRSRSRTRREDASEQKSELDPNDVAAVKRARNTVAARKSSSRSVCRIESFYVVFPDGSRQRRERRVHCHPGTSHSLCNRIEYVETFDERNATEDEIREQYDPEYRVIRPRDEDDEEVMEDRKSVATSMEMDDRVVPTSMRCDYCRKKRIRCDREPPMEECSRCLEKGLQCVRSKERKQPALSDVHARNRSRSRTRHENISEEESEPEAPSELRRRVRAMAALTCNYCREQKLECDKESSMKECLTCRKLGQPCVLPTNRQQPALANWHAHTQRSRSGGILDIVEGLDSL